MALIIGFCTGFVAGALTTIACSNPETIPLLMHAVDAAYRLIQRLLAGAARQVLAT